MDDSHGWQLIGPDAPIGVPVQVGWWDQPSHHRFPTWHAEVRTIRRRWWGGIAAGKATHWRHLPEPPAHGQMLPDGIVYPPPPPRPGNGAQKPDTGSTVRRP